MKENHESYKAQKNVWNTDGEQAVVILAKAVYEIHPKIPVQRAIYAIVTRLNKQNLAKHGDTQTGPTPLQRALLKDWIKRKELEVKNLAKDNDEDDETGPKKYFL